MPSTYSPSLRLELIGAGEQAANWNNTTNYNLGTLLEQAIAGVQSVAVSGASYTLTTGSGVADEARNAVLVLTGTLAASCNVIVPTVDKTYTFRNATTGGFSVVVKTAAGSGVTIANGFTQQVYCDATDVVSASIPINSINGDVVLNGNVGIGTSSPEGRLQANADADFGSAIVARSNTSAANWARMDWKNSNVASPGIIYLDQTGNFVIRNDGAGPVTFMTSGGVGIGTSSPASKLDVSGVIFQNGGPIMPTGALVPYAGSSAPTGWLLCAGQAVSRTTFAALFANIGTTYGSGDGSTTFNLPDLRGRAIFGRDDMDGTASNRITNAVSGITSTTLGAAGGDQRLATHGHTASQTAHNHTINDTGHTHTLPGQTLTGGPGLQGGGSFAYAGSSTNSATTGITINNATPAITVDNFSGGASANIPPAIILNYIIKT